MLIYRFEYDDGDGLFQRWHGGAEEYDEKRDPEVGESVLDMPTPDLPSQGKLADHYNDGSLTEFIFGFTYKKQIRKAMPCPKGRKAVEDHGCRLSIYEISKQHVFSSSDQCIFKRENAKFKGYLDAITLK